MKTQIKQVRGPFSMVKNVFAVVSIFALSSLVLSQSEALAAEVCSKVFATSEVTAGSKSGAQFLHEKDSQLHTTAHVQKAVSQYKRSTGTTLTKPADKVNQWLNNLSRMSTKAANSPRTAAIVKESLHKQFVMKLEEVPEAYYAQQVRIARERGHGDIELSTAQKAQMAETIIIDQKKSLDRWSDYLISKDTSMYPMWLKYWMVSGMTRLSKYDAQTGTFGGRSKETVAPFPELNREALAYVADVVLKKVQKQSLDEIQDPEFLKLLEGMNFGKLYGKVLFKLGVGKQGQFKTNEGRWVVYPQGSDHMPLVNSLEGRNTGWCTAGASTAKSQLHDGDFHVFYSLDEMGQPTIPRVAIRMEADQIAEVRGVAKDQNMDPQIAQSTIVSTKMKTFGEKAVSFEKKDQDMKHLTELERKTKLGEFLSKEDLKFLYEIDRKIDGFGYDRDPRIDQIKSTRDMKNDVVEVFDHKYSPDEISSSSQEVLAGKVKVFLGDLVLSEDALPAEFKFPEVLTGGLKLKYLTSAKGLKLPSVINGDLILDRLTSAEGLVLPTTVNGSLSLWMLSLSDGLKLPTTIKGSLTIHQIKSANGLKFPDVINGELNLFGLKSAEGLKLPNTVNGGLHLNSLLSAEGLKLPDTINGDLFLSSLKSIKGLKFPKKMRGDLFLSELVSASDVTLPDSIIGSLFLQSLTSHEGLKLPNAVSGYLLLNGLKSGRGLKLPKGIKDYVGPADLK